MRFPFIVCVFVCLVISLPLCAQSPNGNINGMVSDPSNAAVEAAEIVVANDVTEVQYTTRTNREGIYVLPNLPPGPYRLQVSKIGFKTLIKNDIVLNVQDSLSINFTLSVGALHELVTVQGGVPLVNTENATVSTVVDRQFADNLPMNGRSFQTLIELTPGVVITPSSYTDGGQFSVNGQRTTSNYWMVDGVSANIGVGAGVVPGNGFGGTLGSFSAVGGTNSLVSVDAMQEFRIQTSTFAPEFGRTPGAQISIVTRSGTNQFHGTAFDYLRNDRLDANNWFNGYINNPSLPKAEERQNDFGGTFSGPIVKSRTFFFFSYEGLRLRLPQTALTTVPDLAARLSALPAVQPFLDAFPEPNGTDDLSTGIAQFNADYSNPGSLDAYSLRLDHRLNSKFTFFGRFNDSPSQINDRGGLSGSDALSMVQTLRINTLTATVGSTWTISPYVANELRLNYSRTNAQGAFVLDNFGGANPLRALPFPEPFTTENGKFGLDIFSLTNDNGISVGKNAQNILRQFNAADSFSRQAGSHSLKFGIDFRRLSPVYSPPGYSQGASFDVVADSETGTGAEGFFQSANGATMLFRNLGAYAQDTWRVRPRLTLTYGVRWDVDFPPAAENGPSIPALTGYSLTNFSNLGLAIAGTAPFKTTYDNFAPRFGMAYQINQSPKWQTVLRSGAGLFYDLVSSETGNLLSSFPPFGNYSFLENTTFPFSSANATPPPIPSTGTLTDLDAFNPSLKLPYTIEWNLAVEQSLGQQQVLSASYVGASGRRLLQTTEIDGPVVSNANLGFVSFVDNTASSDYDALQIQFQRRLSAGLQALVGYTWAHSIDDGSAGAYGTGNTGVPGSNSSRGNSSFDIRHSFTAGLTYDVPALAVRTLWRELFGNWSGDTFILARSAPPVDITDIQFYQFSSGVLANIRPDLVTGFPLYLHGGEYPGRKAFNPAAFANPPSNPSTGLPLRQGTLPRDFMRGFGAAQCDLAIHRNFSIHESLMLQFRAEIFNSLNHPNFGPPDSDFGEGGFGVASQMLGQSLNANNLGGGAFSPLYQIGGPRSIQFALKVIF